MPPSPFAVLHASGHKPPCLRPYRSLDQRLGIVAVPSGGAVHGGDQAALAVDQKRDGEAFLLQAVEDLAAASTATATSFWLCPLNKVAQKHIRLLKVY